MKEIEVIRGRWTFAAVLAVVVVVGFILAAFAQRAEARAASTVDGQRISSGQGQLARGAVSRTAVADVSTANVSAADACDDTQGGCSNLAYWKSAINPNTGEHDIRVQDYKGAYARFDFKGTSIKWITAKSPAGGKTTVLLDGKKVRVFDAYNSAVLLDQVGYAKKGLKNKKHVVELITTSTNPASGGQKTFIDEFRVGAKTYQEDSYRITYGDFGGAEGGVWKGFADSRAYGGSYRASNSTQVPANFYYPSGSEIGIKTAVGPAFGEMYVDVAEYDPSNNTETYAGSTIIDTEAASLAFVTKPITSYTDDEGVERDLDPNKQYNIYVYSNVGDLVALDGWTGDLP